MSSRIAAVGSTRLRYAVMPSPIGRLVLASDGTALAGVWMANAEPNERNWSVAEPDDVLAEARVQLTAYFAGQRRDFDVPLAPRGTEFQLRVWEALRRIPHGTTLSYADLAARIGSPAAVRAVGAANGRNPIPIIVPCHRVIGSNGSLTGFGGGIERKRWLLAHEGALGSGQTELGV